MDTTDTTDPIDVTLPGKPVTVALTWAQIEAALRALGFMSGITRGTALGTTAWSLPQPPDTRTPQIVVHTGTPGGGVVAACMGAAVWKIAAMHSVHPSEMLPRIAAGGDAIQPR